jgi:hypothetical protein
MARPSETEALIARLEASRQRLGGEITALRSKLDLPARIRRQFGRRPWLWFGASAGLGLVASRMLRRRRRGKKRRRGLVRLLMPLFMGFLKPWLRSLLMRELRQRFLDPPASPERGTRFPLSKP